MRYRGELVLITVIAIAGVGMAGMLASQSDPFADRYVSSSFVNWESPHVHPLERVGDRLLAVNTADARLELFSIASGLPYAAGSIPVGIDPVSVRARTATEVWVVNHISDSISVVDLGTKRVVRTISTKDEPCDVVFAGMPQRAFVTCSAAKVVQVFDPADTTPGGVVLNEIAIKGEAPRSMGVSPDGGKVYAAIFESGNGSTVLGGGAVNVPGGMVLGFPPNVVNDASGPYGGVNPPPNVGLLFVPALNPAAGTPPKVGMIVRKNAAGQWMDDNNGNWTDLVSGANARKSGRQPGWDLPDRDLAVIDANALTVSYATRLMTMCMSVGVNPATGTIAVIGTEAQNEKRFEPNITGTFIKVEVASVDPVTLGASVADLNPHLTYSSSSIAVGERYKSLGDPRAIAWNAAGTVAYVAGMGSNNVIAIDASGARLTPTPIEVGEGPTGLALDESRDRLFVLNKFDGSISVVSLSGANEVIRVPFFDPTPTAIKAGRVHLYNTHLNSGLGQVSCASCHVDARNDRLAWDLGDPSGSTQALTGLNLGANFPGLNTGFQPFHPMKGPMTTQTLQDIIEHEPHHWRGDRSGIEAFAGAFVGLQGADSQPNPAAMQEFEDFLASITIPPNPYRNIDNTLPSSLPLPGHYTTGRFGPAGQPLPNGNAGNGMALYRSQARRLDGGTLSCVQCHTLPTGMGTDMTFQVNRFVAIPPGPKGEKHHAVVSVDGSTNVTIKIPQLRTLYKKTGFNTTQLDNTSGFGLLHDGSVDSIERFVTEPVFSLASNQETADMTAFMLAFAGSDLPQGLATNPFEPPGPPSKDTHAAVGRQTTLVSLATASTAQQTLLTSLETQANTGKVGLIVRATINGVERGWAFTGGGNFKSDTNTTITSAALKALASIGSEQTWTIVPKGSETRLGIDRDLDGVLNGNEALACVGDLNSDGQVDDLDFQVFAVNYDLLVVPPASMAADLNQDAQVDDLDFQVFAMAYNALLCP
jgi:YVTN family beta-propeller protein